MNKICGKSGCGDSSNEKYKTYKRGDGSAIPNYKFIHFCSNICLNEYEKYDVCKHCGYGHWFVSCGRNGYDNLTQIDDITLCEDCLILYEKLKDLKILINDSENDSEKEINCYSCDNIISFKNYYEHHGYKLCESCDNIMDNINL